MYRVFNGMSPEIMNDVFKQRSNSHHNPRHTSQIFVNPIHTVYNGTDSASYLGPKIWKEIPSEIRNKKFLEGFKQQIKKWKPMDCLVFKVFTFLAFKYMF